MRAHTLRFVQAVGLGLFAALVGLGPAGCATTSEFDGPTAPGEVTVADFHHELDGSGAWVESRFGVVFVPHAPADFVPYVSNGNWVYADEGWEFESDDPWAVTYHYGRWFKDEALGWVWAPDTVWGPSWVEWREGGSYVGWYVMPPLGFTYDAYGWAWVHTTDFVRPRVGAYVIRGDEVRNAWTAAHPVPRGSAAFGGQWSVGPSPHHIAAVVGRAVPRPQHGGHGGGRGEHGSRGGGGRRR
jgi:hypothetical protein